MNIVNSLKKLYASLGGNADTVKDVQTAPDMVEALANIAASTIELPAVDAEDNGKVLKVDNGKWAKGTDNSLPEVTSEDAGDVLTVNAEGEWTKAAPDKELPDVTSSDDGTLLGVVNGVWGKGLKIKTKTVSAVVLNPRATLSFYILNSDEIERGDIILGYDITKDTYSSCIPNYAEIIEAKIGHASGSKNSSIVHFSSTVQYKIQVGGADTQFPVGDYYLNVVYIEGSNNS